jgi:carboxyl-terminal processing protease
MEFPMNSWTALNARFRQFRLSLLLVGVFITGFFLGSQNGFSLAQSGTRLSRGAEQAFEPLFQVYNLIDTDYLDDVAIESLVDGAINGMVDSLGDQFSGYMDPTIYPQMNSELSGEIIGIGVVIETVEETSAIRIVSVLEGSPAEKAGVQEGDIFHTIDGVDVSDMNQTELSGRVRGAEGTLIEITFLRGDALVELQMRRARITIPNVESELLDDGIGYIRLREFNSSSRQLLDDAIDQINTPELTGLVFDLRGNPGGLLTSAVDIASAFIENGVILYEDFGGNRNEQTFEATGDFAGVTAPIVVLVDENSASASELVAGALQDNEVATIIGQVTFGKGTVQTWQELVNGGGIRLTIARWLTPDRNWIHDQGVTPDIIVEPAPEGSPEDFDPQLEAAIQFLRENAPLVSNVQGG